MILKNIILKMILIHFLKKNKGRKKNEKDVSNINVCSRNANSNCSRLFKNIVVGYYLLVSQI